MQLIRSSRAQVSCWPSIRSLGQVTWYTSGLQLPPPLLELSPRLATYTACHVLERSDLVHFKFSEFM